MKLRVIGELGILYVKARGERSVRVKAEDFMKLYNKGRQEVKQNNYIYITHF